MRQPTLQATILLMKFFHHNQQDKSGMPYWMHPRDVMIRLGVEATLEQRQAALLHDTLEDTGATPQLLYDLGYTTRTVRLVIGMTKAKDLSYESYINDMLLKGDQELISLKLADVYDNSAPGRINKLPEEKRGPMIKKYSMAKSMLEPNCRFALGLIQGTLTSQHSYWLD